MALEWHAKHTPWMHGESTDCDLSLLHTQAVANLNNGDRTLNPTPPRVVRVGRYKLLAWKWAVLLHVTPATRRHSAILAELESGGATHIDP